MSTFLQKRNDEYIRKLRVSRKLAGILAQLEEFECVDMRVCDSNFRQATMVRHAIKNIRDLVDQLVAEIKDVS